MYALFRKIIFFSLFTAMIMLLIIGIGIVDNYNRLAFENHFLNTFYFDTDNYILCFRYLGIEGSISFNLSVIISYFIKSLRVLIISFLILLNKFKYFILGIF